MNSRIIVNGLGYLGLIPFIISCFLVLRDQMLFDYDGAFLFTGYSAVILSFLGGTLWGIALPLPKGVASVNLLIISNLIALSAWVALLLSSAGYKAVLLMLVLGYMTTLTVELQYRSILSAGTGVAYAGFRVTLTSMVVLLHLLLIVYL